MIDFKGILKALKGIDRPKVNKDRQDRFKELVRLHGVEHVALASELAVPTVKVYISARKTVPVIGLESLLQAESILK